MQQFQEERLWGAANALAGMDDVLQKPVLIDDFRAALARFYTSQNP